MNYEDMLKSAREKLPEPVKGTERFEIPNVRGQIEGNKTIISKKKSKKIILSSP